MTADRRSERRSTRSQHSSPYSRQARSTRPSSTEKPTSWSFSGLLNFLNPLRSRSSVEPEPEPEDGMEETSSSDGQSNQAEPLTLASNGHVPLQIPPVPPLTPPTRNTTPTTLQSRAAFPSAAIPSSANVSPSKNIDAVKNYLSENASRQLNQVEIAGLVSLLQDSIDETDEESQEPFRFSRSPSVPARGNSPISPISLATNSADNNQTPSKTLSKNPNGNYRWQGAGSARPRNRFHSPAFGPARSTPSKMKITPAETPKTDTKRRRVGADAETSSPQRVPAMQSPTNTGSASTSAQAGPSKLPNGTSQVNGISPPMLTGTKSLAINGMIATPRILKPTAPSVPSPLRQAWGQNDSPSPSPPHPHVGKQTRAASFMTDLIREATPTKKPDVSNPYQTASPVKPTKPLTKKVPPKRTRPASKPPTEEKVELSPQTIIEATIPKGSKRSRPPSGMTGLLNSTESGLNSVAFPSASPSPPPQQSSPFVNGVSKPSSNERRVTTVDSVEEEESGPSTKKQRTAAPTIVDVKDVDMPFRSSKQSEQPVRLPEGVVSAEEVQSSQGNGINGIATQVSHQGSSRPFFGLKSSIPKEPSKLRFSIQPDKDEKEESTTGSPDSASSHASSLGLNELPTNVFNINPYVVPRVVPKEEEGASDTKDLLISKLPSYDFSFPSTQTEHSKKSNSSLGSKPSLNLPPATPAPAGGFNWAAAGLKAPEVPTAGTWMCSTCCCTNASGDADKCSVCETPR